MGAPSRRIAAAIFFLYAAIQVVRPIAAHISGDAAWSWQMYSDHPASIRYSVELTNGSVKPVAADEFVVHLRPEIDFEKVLPAHLCRHVESAARVIVAIENLQARSYPCRG